MPCSPLKPSNDAPRLRKPREVMIYSLVSVNSWFGFALLEFFNTKLKNVSCEYDRLNSCNSTSLELEKSGAPRPRSVSFAPLLRVRQHRAASSGSFHGHCRGGKRGGKRTHTSDNVPRNVRRQCYGGLFCFGNATLRRCQISSYCDGILLLRDSARCSPQKPSNNPPRP